MIITCFFPCFKLKISKGKNLSKCICQIFKTLRIFYCCRRKKNSCQGGKKERKTELTTELLCKANVYFHIIKICLFYYSHYQTNRGVGNLGEKRYGSLFLLA